MIKVTRANDEATPATETASGRKRLYVASGTALAAAALLTAAAFLDVANINVAAGSGFGVGDGTHFALEVADVDDKGIVVPPVGDLGWVSASGAEGISYELPGADALEPGESVNIDIPVRNASQTLGAALSVGFRSLDTVPSPVADILLFSVEFTDADGDTVPLLAGVSLADANAALTEVIDAGVDGTFNVKVGLPEKVDVAFQGQTTNLRFVIDAASVTPATIP